MLLTGQLALEPGSRVGPVGFDGPHRDAQVLGDFRVGHPGKEPENDDLRRARVDRLEARQRGFERQQIFDRHRACRGGLKKLVENHRLDAAAALLALLMPAVIDEQPPHRLRAESETVGLALPFRAAIVLQP